MGTSLLVIRYPDETLRFGKYQNTSDVCYPRIYDSIEEAFDPNDESEAVAGGEVFDVDVYCDYGGGSHWKAKATHHQFQGGYMSPWYDEIEDIDGVPDWASKAGYGLDWIAMAKEVEA